MIAVYGKARRTHRWFAVLPESAIRLLHDLEGASIADIAPLAEAALAEEGVPRGRYKWVPWRGSGMATRDMIEPLRRGMVDAVFLIDWNEGDFIAEGLRLRRLPSRALDRIRLSSCLWVSEQFLSDRKDAVAGVGRALAKVTTFALENPEGALRLMWRHEPCTRPSSTELDRVLRRDLAIMTARLQSFRIDPGDRDQRWGAIEGTEISAWQDFLIASGAISQPFDPASCYTNELVERFNRFDASRIQDDARAYWVPQAQS